MKRFGKIAVCLGGGLASIAGLSAQELSSTNHPLPDNPYAPIVVRNVFGLNPPAPSDSAEVHADLPRITPNGIISIFGAWNVLFKTSSGSKPDWPAGDKFYDLAEGQIQDEIEVSRVDARKCLVTFKNHGVIQELPLVSTAATGGSDTDNHFMGAHLRAALARSNPLRHGGPVNEDATGANGSPAP